LDTNQIDEDAETYQLPTELEELDK